MDPEGHHLCQVGCEYLVLEIVVAVSFGAVFVVIDQSDTSDVLGKLRAQWQATQLDSILARSMSFTLPSSARAPRGKHSWFCIAFCASTLRTNIITASSYSHNVTDYRSSSRHRPIASLAQLGILRPVSAHFFTRGSSPAVTRSSC